MRDPKEKAAHPGGGGAASKNICDKKNCTTSLAIMLWRAAYQLEASRQFYATHGQHFRRLICCIGLAALRLGRLA